LPAAKEDRTDAFREGSSLVETCQIIGKEGNNLSIDSKK